jgi:hypothetical protein
LVPAPSKIRVAPFASLLEFLHRGHRVDDPAEAFRAVGVDEDDGRYFRQSKLLSLIPVLRTR